MVPSPLSVSLRAMLSLFFAVLLPGYYYYYHHQHHHYYYHRPTTTTLAGVSLSSSISLYAGQYLPPCQLYCIDGRRYRRARRVVKKRRRRRLPRVCLRASACVSFLVTLYGTTLVLAFARSVFSPSSLHPLPRYLPCYVLSFCRFFYTPYLYLRPRRALP